MGGLKKKKINRKKKCNQKKEKNHNTNMSIISESDNFAIENEKPVDIRLRGLFDSPSDWYTTRTSLSMERYLY